MLAVFIAFLVILRWWRKDRELYETKWKVKYTNLVFEDGTFNKVAKLNDELVTVRPIEQKTIREDKWFLSAMKTLKSVSHTNLTTFVGACCDPQNECTIWEYCSKGPLQDLLRPDTNLDPVRQISLALDISNGLLYLHSSEVSVHGNLRMSSIVVDSHWVAKITDFGLSSMTMHRKDKKKESTSKIEKSVAKFVDRFDWRIFQRRKRRKETRKKAEADDEETKIKTEMTETIKKDEDYADLFWTSPERIKRRLSGEKDALTKESDIYSLGVVLSQVVGQHKVYEGRLESMTPKEIVTRVANPEPGPALMRPHIPEDVGRQSVAMATCTHLIESCWSECVDKRPSARKVVKKLKRLTVTKDKNLWDAMTTVKKRYSAKLAPLMGKAGTWCTVYTSIPRAIKTGMCQEVDMTVCFWSLVNFTTFAIQRSPAESLQMIQDIDSLIDNIVKIFKVYQVKTVCNSSMLISGCDPAHNPSHAPIMADASLVLMDLVSNLQILQGLHYHNCLSVRAGLHSGPVMIGVVGKVTPHLCVFGKTVRSTLQCENSSFSQRIHISTPTFNLLQATGMFALEDRDPLDLTKVDGEPSYWLTGRLQDIQESEL